MRIGRPEGIDEAAAADPADRGHTEAELREAHRRKDAFLAALSHELRNALAPLRTCAETLRLSGGRDPDEIARVQGILHRQVEHMVRMVDELLEVSRIAQGVIALHPERLDLAAVIRHAIESSEPLVRAAGHHFEASLPDGPVMLDADPLRLTQIFINLIQNAVKYTDPGGHISLSLRPTGGWAEVSVRDDGRGIAPQDLVYVFDPFTQARGAGDASDGLGLGLSLAARLVELHGGRIEARSPGPGGGSEFVVRLPLATEAGDAPGPAGPAASPEAAPTAVRVLVVDDNADAADSLAAMLRLRSLEVRAVYDGPAGIEALRDFRPSLALVDLGMAGMDGYETARRMRALPEGRDLRLVALTGWGPDHDRVRVIQAGFDLHLVKPACLEDLERVLASLPH